MKFVCCFCLCFFAYSLHAQETTPLNISLQSWNSSTYNSFGPKLRQRNYGAIIGLQRGRNTAFEMGAEMHWRKIGLKKPNIWGATANMEYNFGNNIIGYKAGVWRKQGRVNLTYGGHVGYFTNFQGGHQAAIGPDIGFRLLGFHLVNGLNIVSGKMQNDKTGITGPGANILYLSLRYYFPLQNKFVWDRKDKKKDGGLFKSKKEKEPVKKGLFCKKEAEPKPEEKKGLKKLLNL